METIQSESEIHLSPKKKLSEEMPFQDTECSQISEVVEKGEVVADTNEEQECKGSLVIDPLVHPLEADCDNHMEYHKSKDEPKDEYHYLKNGEFTSEMFKVCVKNIPNRMSYGCFRTTMKSFLGFKPRKVKFNSVNSYGFLTFGNEEEREKAISVLNDRVWKTCTLTCVKAAPLADPFVSGLKRKKDSEDESSRKKKQSDFAKDLTPEEQIVHVVCPFILKPYEEQLKMKEAVIRTCMERLTNNMKYQKIGAEWLRERKDKLCLDILPIIRSPVLENYRNKAEFTIGEGPDKKDNTIGFRMGSYREGNLVVVEATKCINCCLKSLDIAKDFQNFIQGLPYPSYHPSTHLGLWRQLTVRTFTTGDAMVIVQVNPAYFSSDEEYNDLQKKLIEFFTVPEQANKVSSVYISSSSQRNNNIDTFKFLAGEEHITEKLCNLQFRISPEAFFQVNTRGAEILYRTVHDWCDTNQENACVLDVCCGTGTIGLCIANGTSYQVTGIEICQQAVDDAKFNADFNGIKNAKFVCGPAENVIASTVKGIQADNVIAIVDPPRAGLRRNVIETLRKCSKIKKIIYVSCSPKQAAENFLSFCRPQSKRYQGVPFKTVRCLPVDLFPHTPNCELIVELVRLDYNDNSVQDDASVESKQDVNEHVIECKTENEEHCEKPVIECKIEDENHCDVPVIECKTENKT